MATDDVLGGRSRADSLAGVPLFAGIAADADRGATPLSASPWAALAAAAEPERLNAGEWLWRQGEPGDALYVVLTGRLEVVAEDAAGSGTVIRVLGRGDAVGELALLTDSPRSASVRARRDSELLKVARADFEQLLDERPEFARSLTRVLGEQLRDVRHQALDANPIPGTIALIPLQTDLPLRDIGSYGSMLLGSWHAVTMLDGSQGGDPDSWGNQLDAAERDHEQVLLLAHNPDPSDPWTAFCERQADRTVVIARDGELPPGLAKRTELHSCELVLLEPRSHRLDPWLDALAPRNAYVVPDGAGQAPVVEALARRMAGRSIGLVLSGGGARAFAHIGVLEELLARGYVIDRVGGCSGGAFIGGLFAMGKTPDEILAITRREFVDTNPTTDYTLPLVALTRGQKGGRMVERVFGETTIEELPRDYFCVSTDMITSELVVHRRGLLADAAAASMTLPGVFPPRPNGGTLLLDGGLLNNLPADVMAADGEGPVIASDVSARFEPPQTLTRSSRPRLTALRAAARAWIVGRSEPMPSFPETIVRSIVLGSQDTSEIAARYADIVIEPNVAGAGLLEWKRIDDMVAAGRAAAAEALDKAPAELRA